MCQKKKEKNEKETSFFLEKNDWNDTLMDLEHLLSACIKKRGLPTGLPNAPVGE